LPSVRVVLTAATAALILALVPSALAAKRGATGATITFNPTTVAVGQTYQVNVSGLRPNTWGNVGAYYISSDAAYWCSGTSDSAGSFSCTFTAEKAGTILHEAYQKNHNRYRLQASAYLTVSP